MWDLPGPGIKPMSPALAGGFFTTESPGKSYGIFFNFQSALTIWQRFRKLLLWFYLYVFYNGYIGALKIEIIS